jgi:hypothetical protein
MVHVLRVDEDLEGPPDLVLGIGVQHDVVDGDIQGVVRERCLDLVGRAEQHLGPLDLLVHVLDIRARRGALGLDDAVLDDVFLDGLGHGDHP